MMTWGFAEDDVGRLNVAQVTISFGLLFTVLGLDQAYVREFYETTDRNKLFKSCFVPGMLLLLAISLLTLPFASTLSFYLFATRNAILYYIVLASIIISFASRFLSLILRMEERGFAFSMSQIFPKILLLAIITLIMIAPSSYHGFLELQLAFFTSLLFVLFALAWTTRAQWLEAISSPLADTHQIRELFAFGFPLVFAGLAYWGLTATSTFALRGLAGFSELALYSVAASFAGAASILQSIFSLIWAPTVYKWVASNADMKRVDAVARQLLALVTLIVVASGSFTWLIDFVLPTKYIQVKYLVQCTLVQPLLYTLSEVTSIGISIARRTTLSIWITCIAMAFNVILSVVLIPSWGARGAAVANATAFLIYFVGRTEVAARVWMQFPRRRTYAVVIILISMSIMTTLYGPRSPIPVSFMWIGLVPLMGWIFRNEWKYMSASLRSLLLRRRLTASP